MPDDAVVPGFGRLALHTWTLDTTDRPTALEAAKQAGYAAMELRWTDFKRCFEKGSTDEQVLDIIRASGMPVGVLGVEYGWIFATGSESDRLWRVFRQSCENAVALGCDTIMSAPGPLTGTVPQAIGKSKIAGDVAAEFGRLCCKLGVGARLIAGRLCRASHAMSRSSRSLMSWTASARADVPSPKARSTMRASPQMSPVTLKARAWPIRSARMISKPLMVA